MSQPPQPGERVGAYLLEQVVASGGQGIVYRGRHTSLGTLAAIKFLHVADPVTVTRFQREAQALASLRHPHLVRVMDLGHTPGGLPFLIMEFVEGGTLRDRVRQGGPLEAVEAVALLAPIADALAHCHALGILHRDVKPDNILIAEGRALLVDFGLVRRDPDRGPLDETRAERLTQTGEIVGTPSYMAPEQADASHAEIGPPCDVYGLAATLYFALTGDPPFSAGSVFATLNRMFTEPSPDPRQVRPELPAALAELCLAGLSKPSAQRPASSEFANALRASLAPPPRRGPRLAIGVGAVVLALVLAAGVGAAFLGGSPTPISPPRPRSPSPTLSPSPTSPSPTPVATPPPNALPTTWTRVNVVGRNWTPRRQPSAIAWKNKLWVFPEAGDITDQHEIHCSSDQGATWTEVDTRGFVGPAKFSTTVVHDGRLFWLGGDSSTHPEQQLREVTLQRNGALAQKKTAKAPGGFSMSITALSFGGHLWLLGGSSPRQGLSPSEKHSDRVYRSHTSDPLRFTQVKAPTPPRRTGGRALVYRDQMWILGGRHWKPNGDSEPLNDVWSTKDPAKGWTKVEATHSFPPRDLFAACVWRDRMWVGGGFGPLTGSFDIWHSVDGAYWNKLKVGAAPRQRLLTSLVAQPDRLILLGGELPREGEGEIRRTTNEIWYLE